MNLKALALLPLLALPFNGIADEGKAAAAPEGKVAAHAKAEKAKAKVKAKKSKKVKKAMEAKHEHWVCPMHDGGESDHAGKCPKCGMDLVKEVK